MKKTTTLFALTLVSSLLAADGYYDGSSCPYGNCGDGAYNGGYNGGYYYQGGNQNPPNYYQGREGYYQGGYQGQPPRNDYYQRNPQPYSPPRNQPPSQGQYQGQYQGNNDNRPGDYENRNAYYNNRGSDYENRGSDYDNRQENQSNASDQEIGKKIHDTLSDGWVSKGYPNVSYEVNNGNVTLRGSVESIDDKNKIEDNLRKVDGVRQINNLVRVTGKTTAYNDRSYSADTADKVKKAERDYPQDVAATDSDQVLNAKIRDKLSGWFNKDYTDITLKTSNGVVTITGSVDNVNAIQKMNDKLKDVKGIKSINNEVIVKNKQQ